MISFSLWQWELRYSLLCFWYTWPSDFFFLSMESFFTNAWVLQFNFILQFYCLPKINYLYSWNSNTCKLSTCQWINFQKHCLMNCVVEPWIDDRISMCNFQNHYLRVSDEWWQAFACSTQSINLWSTTTNW